MTPQRANRTSRPRRGAVVALVRGAAVAPGPGAVVASSRAALAVGRGAVVALCAAACVTAALTHAAPAGATATRIGVYPDINYGPLTNYGTGCSYTVEARLTSAVGPVSFYDNGVLFTTVPPTGGVAIVPWSPASRGTHVLAASQSPEDGVLATVAVEVGVGLPIGTSCLVV